jgi:hypothetical protein
LKEPLFLRIDEVIEIHNNQKDLYGGTSGIRDFGLLKSAIAMPATGSHTQQAKPQKPKPFALFK